jgi:hypothetical protein
MRLTNLTTLMCLLPINSCSFKLLAHSVHVYALQGSLYSALNKSFTSPFISSMHTKYDNVTDKYVPALKEYVGVKVEFHVFLI